MVATPAILAVKDGGATSRNMRVLDESGAGSGPFRNVAYVMRDDPESNFWNYAAAAGGILNSTTAVTIKGAAGASVRNYISGLQVMAEALTNATEFAIRDGAGGTVLWRTKIPTGGLASQSVKFDPPLKGTANTLIEIVTLTASGAGAVYANLQGFIAA